MANGKIFYEIWFKDETNDDAEVWTNSSMSLVMGESTDLRIRTLENPHQYPEGQEAIPIQSRGVKPWGIGLELSLGPRDEVWIFQGTNS